MSCYVCKLPVDKGVVVLRLSDMYGGQNRTVAPVCSVCYRHFLGKGSRDLRVMLTKREV